MPFVIGCEKGMALIFGSTTLGKKSWDREGVPICIRGGAGYHRRGGDEAALGTGKPAKAATGRGIQPYFLIPFSAALFSTVWTDRVE